MTRNLKINPTKRFSNRVEYYIKYRPKYPQAIIEVLKKERSLENFSVIADIGSGTGFLSELFLRNKNSVFAVEPNKEMREAAEKLIPKGSNFVSVNGRAEATTLDSHSIDFITAGQAFHWFDVEKSRSEFARILKPEGWVALIWNDRKIDSTPFLIAYEEFLHRNGTNYWKVRHKTFDQNCLKSFFGHERFKLRTFENFQVFDRSGLKGRVLSSSYIPAENQPGYDSMMKALNLLFDKFQVSSKVTFEYKTKMFFGQLK